MLRRVITGFNTDVDYDGRVFHVQTEDRGRGNPIVESLVYSGGEIVDSRRTSYGDLIAEGKYSEAEILRIMDAQHALLVREIQNGRFDPEGPKPFGYNLITNRSLDEVVLAFLSGDPGVERIRLEMDSHEALPEGGRATMRLRVVSETSDRPIPSARVAVKLITTTDRPRELFAGTTGPDGALVAEIDVPAVPSGQAAVLCQAESGGQAIEIKRLVRKGA